MGIAVLFDVQVPQDGHNFCLRNPQPLQMLPHLHLRCAPLAVHPITLTVEGDPDGPAKQAQEPLQRSYGPSLLRKLWRTYFMLRGNLPLRLQVDGKSALGDISSLRVQHDHSKWAT